MWILGLKGLLKLHIKLYKPGAYNQESTVCVEIERNLPVFDKPVILTIIGSTITHS